MTKKVTSTLTLQGVHCALGTIDLNALVRLLSNLRDTILILPVTYVGFLVTLCNNSCMISTMYVISLGLKGLEFLEFHHTFKLPYIAH